MAVQIKSRAALRLFNSILVCLTVACDLKSLVCHVSPLPESHFEASATLDAAGSFTSHTP